MSSSLEFREYSEQETPALVNRLLARQSEESVRELQKLRQALTAALDAAESAVSAPATAANDADVAAFVRELATAAAGQVERSTAQERAEAKTIEEALRAELAATSSEQKALSASLAEARAALEGARRELKQQASDRETLEAALENARRQSTSLAKDLASFKERSEGLQSDLKTATSRAEVLEARLEEANRVADAARVEAAQAREKRSQLEMARQEIETARHQEARARAAAETELAKIRARVAEDDRPFNDLQTRLGAAVAAEVDLQRQVQDAERAAGTARAEAEIGALDRLLTVFEEIERAGTIGDVLGGLVRAFAVDFPRVALFSVKGNRLEGAHQLGLAFKSDISKVVIPLTMESLLSRAVASGRAEGETAAEMTDSSRALFGGSPECALAVPISVNRETIAVIYADDSGQPRNEMIRLSSRIKFAELLRGHCQPLLHRLSTELKAFAELRDYATLLLNEVEYLHSADVSAGKPAAELQSRLRDNLQCARGIYAQRIEAEGVFAPPLLDERIAAIVNAKTSTAFARDLAATIARDRSREHAGTRTAVDAIANG